MKDLIIEPGIGIGEYKFGVTRDMLKKSVGEPDEVEHNEEPDQEVGKIEVWHFDEAELSVEFIEGNDWRLSTIAVNSEECKLNDLPLLGKKTSEIVNLIDVLNLGEYDSEKIEFDESHDVTLISVYESGINFWFEEDILTEIQLNPIAEVE